VQSAQGALPLRARDLEDAAGNPDAAGAEPAPRFFADLNYVGQVHRTYLVCEAADELILIDQHAAHERVAYARLRAAHARRQMPRRMADSSAMAKAFVYRSGEDIRDYRGG